MGEFSRAATGDVEERERRGGGASSRDISGTLGAENMAIRMWRYAPGHEMAYHRHQTQEEIYQLVSGGPLEVVVDGETLSVEDGEWLRLPKDTPRKICNHSDREAVWLTIAAPIGEGIRDGIRLDPETGEEIPRT